MTHGTFTESLTERSVSHSLNDHIGKGREGKGRETGGEGLRLSVVFLSGSTRIRSNGYLPRRIGFGVDQ